MSKKKTNFGYDEETIVLALKEYLSGATILETADKFGVTKETIRNWLGKAEIPARPEPRNYARDWDLIRKEVSNT